MNFFSKQTVKNKTPFLWSFIWDANKEGLVMVWEEVKIQCKKFWKKLTEKFAWMK